jgi:hypothetical protein
MKLSNPVVWVCIVLVPNFSQAQILSKWGVKTAFTRSKLEVRQFSDFTSWRSGLNFAIFGEHTVNDWISVSTSLEYVQKGYLNEQVETDESGNEIQDVIANTRLDYLSMFPLIKIQVPKRIISPFLTFGPRVDYLLHARKGQFRFTDITVTDDFADFVKSFVIGASLSGGVQMPVLERLGISLEFRYNIDFTDSAREPVQYLFKNKTYDIWAGLAF